jgi:hypothetical protein
MNTRIICKTRKQHLNTQSNKIIDISRGRPATKSNFKPPYHIVKIHDQSLVKITQDSSRKRWQETRYYHTFFNQDYHEKTSKQLEMSRNALVNFLGSLHEN